MILQLSTAWEATNGISLLKASSHQDWDIQIPALVKIDELGRRLPDLVAQDSRFPGNRVWMVRSINGGQGFYPRFIGVPMVRHLLKSSDPVKTIGWLLKVLQTTHAAGWSVSLLWYVSVDEPMELADGITIAPVDRIPKSHHQEWIESIPGNVLRSPIGMIDLLPPMAALIQPVKIEPFVFSPSADDTPILAGEEQTRMYWIAMALSVIGPRPVVPVASWTTLEDPDLEEAYSGGGRMQSYPEVIPGVALRPWPVVGPEACAFVRKYLALPAKTTNLLNVAISRLNMSLRRHLPGDSAIELSIAFEALTGDQQKTEVTHKVKVRATRMLGGETAQRRRNAAVIAAMYDMRSSLMHSGNLPKKVLVLGQKANHFDLIREAASLCAALIARLVDLGEVPNWSVYDIDEHP